jgi:hypothetical protein
LLVITLRENVSLLPLPRALPKNGVVAISASIKPRYRAPQLVVTAPSGEAKGQAMVLQTGSSRFIGTFRCLALGRHRLEVTATGKHGSEVLANIPVYCGKPAPSSLRYRSGRKQMQSAASIEKRVFALTNAFRSRAGRPPLMLDGRLSVIARAHSADMRENDFVGHVSAKTGGPRQAGDSRAPRSARGA